MTVKQAHLSAMHADAPSAAAMPSGEIYTAAMAWRARVSRYQIQIALTALAAFAVPFDLFYRLILFHFYVRGSFPYDTGLLAALMWHNSIALNLPVSLGGMSFFSQHVAPLLILVSAVSEVLPLSMAQLFAGFTGVCHGLLALAVFWLLVGGFGMRRGWKLALAGVIAVAFAVNGQAIAIARYPHFEAFAAASLLLFFVALVLEHRTIAVVSFLCALATREDAGLHAFGFLSIWAGLNWLRGVPWSRSRAIVGFAIAGLAYSSVVLLAQHRAFPDASSFVRIYLGDPALAHVSLALLGDRLLGWLWLHSAIFLPATLAIAWSIRDRDPYIAAGYVACVPWMLLHLFAVSDLAGLMVGYYAYPLLIAMAWPWIGVLISRQREPMRELSPMAAAGRLLATIALSLLPIGVDYDPGRIGVPEAFLRPPSAEQQVLTDRAIAAIAAGRPALGRLVADSSVVALLPDGFARDEMAGLATGSPDTVVFFANGFDAGRLAAVPGLPVRYVVPGTAIQIMTNRSEATLRDLAIAR